MKYLKTFEEQSDSGNLWASSNKLGEEEKDITKPNCRNCGAAFSADKTSCPYCKSAYKETEPVLGKRLKREESDTAFVKSSDVAHQKTVISGEGNGRIAKRD